MSTENKLPAFLKNLAPWERRFSRKYRVELIHRMPSKRIEEFPPPAVSPRQIVQELDLDWVAEA